MWRTRGRNFSRNTTALPNAASVALHESVGYRPLGVYEKVGFRVEARKRQAIYKFGAYQDVIVMGLLEGELRLDG